MTLPQHHYDGLLAEHYTWMCGVPFADKVAEQADLLRRAGVAAPGGLDRFIPLRADADRIMTCFLESNGSESVMVHDLIHVRQGETWTLRKSAYPKLFPPSPKSKPN